MKKIDEIKYKGFKTEFFITEKVKIYLQEKNIPLDKLKQRLDNDNENYSFFYEVILFEIIDEDEDGIPDEKFGKNFKVVYNGIVTRRGEKSLEEGFEENFDYDKEKVISIGSSAIGISIEPQIVIKEKILME